MVGRGKLVEGLLLLLLHQLISIDDDGFHVYTIDLSAGSSSITTAISPSSSSSTNIDCYLFVIFAQRSRQDNKKRGERMREKNTPIESIFFYFYASISQMADGRIKDF